MKATTNQWMNNGIKALGIGFAGLCLYTGITLCLRTAEHYRTEKGILIEQIINGVECLDEKEGVSREEYQDLGRRLNETASFPMKYTLARSPLDEQHADLIQRYNPKADEDETRKIAVDDYLKRWIGNAQLKRIVESYRR
ncbi:hypothetical protein HZB02_06300 [Candidatus Woesearchaeota archaeon]|nr:hypothetical protein [Candidatus Woesearchaeota archaeon]